MSEQSGLTARPICRMKNILLNSLESLLSVKKQRLSLTRSLRSRIVLKREIEWPERVPELTVRQICDCAQLRYQPKPLKIPHIVLVRAQRGEGGDDTPYQQIYADDAFGWRAVAENLTLVDVDGGHSTMLRERCVDSLAAALLPYLWRRGELAFENPACSVTEIAWENLLCHRQEV